MKKKYLFIIIISSLLFTAMYYFGQSGMKRKIICFGDSITYGANVEGRGWPEQLSGMEKDFLFVNKGRKGRKTSDRNELLPIIDENNDAALVIFLLGVNDLKNGNDSLVNECYMNMQWMIKETKKKIKDVKILLLSPCGINLKNMSELNRSKKYNKNTVTSLINLEKKYQQLASQESVYFESLLNTVSPENFLDGIHPNENGYREIAREISVEFKNIFPNKN